MDSLIARRQDVAHIVMRPGHGKSYNHLKIRGLVEADSVVNCKANETLQFLRRIAKCTGKWEEYDSHWANMISERLTPHRWVVLVPSASVGTLLGAISLGTAELEVGVWTENLRSRGKRPNDYSWSTYDPDSAQIFHSNKDLSDWILRIADKWIN